MANALKIHPPLLLLTTILMASLAPTAHAQFGNLTIGNDARSLAMGGAGIATGGANRANPASLAFTKNTRIYFPTVGLRAEGALNEVTKLDNVSKFIGGSEQDKKDAATDMARKFATRDSLFGFNTGFGVRVGPLEVQANGVAQGKFAPNQKLRDWANSNPPAGQNAPSGSGADLSAAALYTLPSVGFGLQLPARQLLIGGKPKALSIGVGARLKYVNSVYSHYVATTNGSGTFTSARSSELGGKDFLEKKGLAADLGAMGNWEQDGALLSGGVVLTNIIKPSMNFLDVNGKTFNPIVQTISAGASFHKGSLTFAGDIVNLTNSPSIRVGGEQKLGPIALRAGFTTRGGVTYGLGIFGFDIALGKGQPLEVVQTLRF